MDCMAHSDKLDDSVQTIVSLVKTRAYHCCQAYLVSVFLANCERVMEDDVAADAVAVDKMLLRSVMALR